MTVSNLGAVIDLRLVRDDPDRVRASPALPAARTRQPSTRLLAADDRRRTAVTRADALRAEQKAIGRAISRATPAERPHLLTKARHLADEVKSAESR